MKQLQKVNNKNRTETRSESTNAAVDQRDAPTTPAPRGSVEVGCGEFLEFLLDNYSRSSRSHRKVATEPFLIGEVTLAALAYLLTAPWAPEGSRGATQSPGGPCQRGIGFGPLSSA